jgi:hypothetical protein
MVAYRSQLLAVFLNAIIILHMKNKIRNTCKDIDWSRKQDGTSCKNKMYLSLVLFLLSKLDFKGKNAKLLLMDKIDIT